MASAVAQQFRERLAAAEVNLGRLTREQADEAYRDGSWLRKEVVGHLIDSSINNHARFAAAAIAGAYRGPQYDQAGWVHMGGYASLPWEEVFAEWKIRNRALVRVVDRVAPEAMNAPCVIGDAEPVTLEFLILDYLDHLEHHLREL